jgi:glucose/arabinose dehydrogenase
MAHSNRIPTPTALAIAVLAGVFVADGAPPPPAPQWIRSATIPHAGEPVFMRTSFRLDSLPTRADLAVACDGTAHVFINDMQAATASGYLQATRADVSSLMRRGQNTFEVRAVNPTNTPALLARLFADGPGQSRAFVVTDRSWLSSTAAVTNSVTGEFVSVDWTRVQALGPAGTKPWGDPFDPTRSFDAYNAWKGSLGTRQATPVANISAPPGFTVELVRSAQEGEGPWISMAFDPQGRLAIAREKSGLLRFTLTPRGEVTKVEVINDNLLECRGLLYAHGALCVNANNSKALYRLRSTRGDDSFDEVKLLKSTEGGVGHGRNGLALGPDGVIYFVHGNNVRLPADLAPTSPYQNFAEDRLLPCAWDNRLFDSDAKAPCGHVMRTDAEGTRWEIVAGGFRNPYDLAFNRNGELFTFDADMEWDVGAPWYRPNRVQHVIPGGEYGWRRGTSMWPTDWPDSLPPVANIGVASPTGVKFCDSANFPAMYRDALFICDWAYGRILAVHLQPQGASYSGATETFLTGRPLNVTDVEFGPDGAMWFTTGGRGTQAGLYRVSSRVREETSGQTEDNVKVKTPAAVACWLRRKLETFYISGDPEAVAFACPQLAGKDPWLRHAARLAVERQDTSQWRDRALNETQPQAALTAHIALARSGSKDDQPALLGALDRLAWSKLSDEQRIALCRAYHLAFIRMGRPDPATSAHIAAKLDAAYPGSSTRVNAELCELLVYLDSPHVIRKTLTLVARAKSQEEELQLMFTLRNVASGWTLDERRAFFKWFDKAANFTGGRTLPAYIADTKKDAMATLTNAERIALAPLLNPPPPKPVLTQPAKPRPFVKQWQMGDLVADISAPLTGRSVKRGRDAFAAAQCWSLCSNRRASLTRSSAARNTR